MMKRRAIRHDLSFLVSAGLLVVATFAAVTGWVSDLLDLNDFVYHSYAGYSMAVLALLHVYLHWRQLTGYARWRLGKRSRRRRGVREGGQARSAPALGPFSRRGFVGLVLGGLGGFALGRGLRRQPALAYGADVGVVYHEWSKPYWLSLLGTVASWGSQPALYKTYAGAEGIPLPPPGRGIGYGRPLPPGRCTLLRSTR
jgi:hypothetical protein